MGNNPSRIREYDYIRVISLFGILICHSCLDLSQSTIWIGRFLGTTFNFLFLVLSAFIFGQLWNNNNRSPYNLKFVSKRIVKLSRSYYPYLVFLFFFLYITQSNITYHQIITHIFYLSWFDKIKGFGHLWFMTMIVLCYCGCYIVTKRAIASILYNRVISLVLVIGGIGADYYLSKFNLPGYLFSYLVGYLLIFFNANELISRIKKINIWYNIIQFAIINSFGILMFYQDIFTTNPFFAYLLGMGCALSEFCFLLNICSKFPTSKIIILLSSISFEIYLVHEFFLGNYSIYRYVNNPIIAFFALVFLSIIAAIILHTLSKIKIHRHGSK